MRSSTGANCPSQRLLSLWPDGGLRFADELLLQPTRREKSLSFVGSACHSQIDRVIPNGSKSPEAPLPWQ